MGCSGFRVLSREGTCLRLAVSAWLIYGILETGSAAAEALPAFSDLLRQSETQAPRLIEGQANLQAAQGLARQAAAWPNPTASYESENFGGSNNFSRISPVQNTVSLSETFEIGGKRAARIAAVLGDNVTALSLLRGAFARGCGHDIALHTDIDLSRLSADERYREMLRPKG